MNSFERNASNPNKFEMIVNIDTNDQLMKKFLDDQINIRKFKIKYIESPPGYFNGHIHNNMAQKLANNQSYFIACLTDRMTINTKNWDDVLEKYRNFHEDGIFRITCSTHKNRNYIDFWESCFAPSNVVFTTRKWIETCDNNWSPVFSADAFQQSISYYMKTYDTFSSSHYNRDVSDNTLNFSGQNPEEKDENEKYERYNGQLKAWDILVSPKVQKIAKKRAMKLILMIMQHKHSEISYIENTSSYKLYKDKKFFLVLNYNINSLKYNVNNFFRKFYYLNYAGSGFKENSHPLLINIAWYLNYRYKLFMGLKDFYNRMESKKFW